MRLLIGNLYSWAWWSVSIPLLNEEILKEFTFVTDLLPTEKRTSILGFKLCFPCKISRNSREKSFWPNEIIGKSWEFFRLCFHKCITGISRREILKKASNGRTSDYSLGQRRLFSETLLSKSRKYMHHSSLEIYTTFWVKSLCIKCILRFFLLQRLCGFFMFQGWNLDSP